MGVPDYESLMLPVLKLAAQGEIRMKDCIERLANDLGLTEEDRKHLLPGGKQTTFANRVHWARAFLVQAGLLKSPKWAHVIATERGLQVLAQNPPNIDNELLLRFPEFREFRKRRRATATSEISMSQAEPSAASLETPKATPEELVDAAYSEITEELRSNLLDRIVAGTPAFFEKLIIDLLVAMGYGGSRVEAGRRVGRTGDEGIDGIINEDQLGLDVVYLQAKKYTPGNVVGAEKVREFAGSLMGRGATKGVFVTTSHFAPAAKAYVDRLPQRLILIDGEELTKLMVRFGVGVRVERIVEFKKIDLDYFDEEGGL